MSKKILIVEDETSLMKALDMKLTAAGYQIFKAKDGEQGVKVAEKEKPDLILLDLLMPKMSGLDMLSELRKTKWGAKAKVIVLTNYSDETRTSEAFDKGVSQYLIKADLSIDDIINKIKEAL